MRPYVILKAAVSIDGYIDDFADDRLILSNPLDFDRVDAVRAECDAFLVGAGTIRADNPRLLVNSADRRAERIRNGLPEHPLKVTVSGSGKLSSDFKFWHHGGDKLAYTTDRGHESLSLELAGLAEVVSLGSTVDFASLLDDLGTRGIRRLLVEGGGSLHTAFLTQDLVDELQLAIAPLLVGEEGAPRFLSPGQFPGSTRARLAVAEVRPVGDMTLIRYLPQSRTEPNG